MKIIETFEALVEALKMSTEGIEESRISPMIRNVLDEKLFKPHFVRWDKNDVTGISLLKPLKSFFSEYIK